MTDENKSGLGIEDTVISIPIDGNLITKEVTDFAHIAGNCIRLYAKKNHDYGNSFDKGMDTIGVPYGIGRIFDKMNRIINLTKFSGRTKSVKEAVVEDEKIEDTLMDMACYSIMMLAYLSNQKEKEHNNIEFE